MRSYVLIVLSFSGMFAVAAHATVILPLPPGASPLITTTLDPSRYVVAPPSLFDGVARLAVDQASGLYGCSGSLLEGGQFIVTAAHCVAFGTSTPSVRSLTATFNNGQTYVGAAYYVPPAWTGYFGDGHDIALVRLSRPVTGLSGYQIWTGPDPWASAVNVAGYGRSGLGSTGATGDSGTLRAGWNDLDPFVWAVPGQPYGWDFDNGLAANDTLCLVAGVCGTGRGGDEVLVSPGDSGGPLFHLGYLLAVHSFGGTYGIGDIDGILNSSFGEVAGDTRVNAHASWMRAIIDGQVAVPEPGSVALLAIGLAAVLCRARRRSRGQPSNPVPGSGNDRRP